MDHQPRKTSAEQPVTSSATDRDTPEAYFEAGLRLLQAGQLAQAEQCGRQALTLDECHSDSMHLMGMLCIAAQRYELAIEWFAMAIRQNPGVADYFVNLGMALQRKERFDEAIRSYDRALLLNPDQLGVWLRMAELLLQQERFDEAIKCFDRAVTLDGERADIWYRMGEILKQQKRTDEAILSFDQALKVKPDYWEAANASGLLYVEMKRYEEALARFSKSAEIDPTQAGAFNYLSCCQWPMRRFEDALANARKAYDLAPDNPEITKNVGLLLQRLDRQEEALPWFDKALALRADFPSALNDRATTLFALRRIEEAFADLDRAVAFDPACPDHRWNRSLFQLLVGNFAEGWQGREWGRKSTLVSFTDRKFTQPHWFGDEPIAGKTILLHSDEGLGDSIQYSRYAAMVAKLGARVILEVDSPLQPLLQGLEGVSLCLRKNEALPEFDLHCPLGGLPLAFKTRLETIPAAPSYLPPLPEARLCAWQDRLGAHDRLRVGLVWSGNPAHFNDRNRSTTLEKMSAIFDCRASFYSLQKDPRAEDRVTLSERSDVIDLTEHLTDFVETAALICHLDLVVTVDTSVAHLAAAQGCPTWILLPQTPDYRWLLGRDDSPWYPSVRLFRQGEDRDYESVLARVREELGTLVAAFRAERDGID
ncbi:MAG: tetratricopeptide repeat protein [Bradyrhizobium sp.]|nr:tetratricopeptide repeat protein [Bradyrhizobium sp.]